MYSGSGYGWALGRLTGDPALSGWDERIHYFIDREVLAYWACLMKVVGLCG